MIFFLNSNYPSLTATACSPTFLIHNNGCLALKYTAKCRAPNHTLILAPGSHTLDFKVCYYDLAGVSCSPLYQQQVRIAGEVLASSKLSASVSYELYSSKIEAVNNASLIGDLSGLRLVQSIGSNVYFIVLVVLLAVTVIILILVLVKFRFCTKGAKNAKLIKDNTSGSDSNFTVQDNNNSK